ncbi:hypothetical protein R3P38DRAFT_2810287 [Favolaschia claudopus]|uniref:Uncharacterized protein n=1 Tax=Favolaschia claudopus TaxID=2862362 RepID=A0AAV9ZB47_9AGAR
MALTKKGKNKSAPRAKAKTTDDNATAPTEQDKDTASDTDNDGDEGDDDDASSTKKKEGDDDDDAPKKRGNPGDFHGSRAVFLRGKVDEYCKASKDKTTRKFFPKLFSEYWALYPWEIPHTQEPPASLQGYGKADRELGKDELAKKNEIKKNTEAKIKRWLTYVRRNTKGGKNPYTKWLHQLSHIEERAPKRMPLYQLYMQDEKKNGEVNRLFQERFPELVGSGNTIQQRTAIARELLANESEDARAALKEKGEEAFAAAMAEFKAGGGVEAEAVDDLEVQQEARRRLAVTVQPLIDSLRAITGCQILFVAGTVVSGSPGEAGFGFHRLGQSGLQICGRSMDEVFGGRSPAATPDATGPLTPRETAEGVELAVPPPPAMPTQEGDVTLAVPPPPATAAVTAAVTAAPSQPIVSAATTTVEVDVASATSPPVEPIAARTRRSKRGDTGATIAESRAEEGDGEGGDDGQDEYGSGDDGEGWEGDEDEWAGWPQELDARLAALPLVASPLRRAIKRLEPSDQEFRLRELERGNELFQTRESNMARTAELLEDLGLKQDLANLMKEIKVANKKRPSDGEGPATKRRKPNEEDEYDGEEEDGEDEDGDGEGDKGTTGGKRGPGRKNIRAPPGADENGIAHWARSARDQLLGGECDDEWTKVVELWWKQEERAGFIGPAKAMGTKYRPKEVAGWISRARVGGPQPAILDVYGFAALWWKYWVAINPEWRTRVRDGRRLAKEGEGDWSALKKETGKNGLLNVLICLRWWRDALRIRSEGEWLREGVAKDWKEAVEEVRWVLEKFEEGRANANDIDRMDLDAVPT